MPFIAGANLDEGPSYSFLALVDSVLILKLGTDFAGDPTKVTSTSAQEQLLGGYTPSLIPGSNGPALLNATATILLKMYPDIPALGSPYGTGNNTFGFNSGFKRVAALCTMLPSLKIIG